MTSPDTVRSTRMGHYCRVVADRRWITAAAVVAHQLVQLFPAPTVRGTYSNKFTRLVSRLVCIWGVTIFRTPPNWSSPHNCRFGASEHCFRWTAVDLFAVEKSRLHGRKVNLQRFSTRRRLFPASCAGVRWFIRMRYGMECFSVPKLVSFFLTCQL